MCYHVSTPGEKKLKPFADLKGLQLNFTGDNYYHVSGFDQPLLPVTLTSDPASITEARWKLLPFWVKTEAEGKKYANTLNADCSGIFEKKSYAPFILKNKGLLYVDGFYEPHKVAGVKETENYFIYQPDHSVFTLGIVYAPWTDKETGEHLMTFSVITVPANPLLEEIHNVKKRMPLVIPETSRQGWLDAKTKEETAAFFQPYDGELMAHKTIRVTGLHGRDTNTAEIQQPI